MADSRLADIYRKELKSKGLLGAFVSASGARIKEKTDIRNMLPQTGISGAAFEKMFGKKYRYGASKDDVRSTRGGGSDSDVSKSMEEKLTRIGVDMKIMAKNSVVLPAMARDMNVMRLNMQKMVKLAGGSPTKSADMFFKRASDRETQYESQYKRTSGGISPTALGGSKKEGGGGGIFDLFKSILSTNLTSILSGLFEGLLKAGLLAGLLAVIGKYFEGGEFKKSVDSMLNSIFSTIFGEDYKKNIWDGVKILGGAILAVKAGFVIFELAIAAAARKMWAFAAGTPGGGPGGAPGKKGGKFGAVGKFGLLLGAGLTAAQIYEMFGGKEQAEAALGEKFEGGENPNAPGAPPTSESVPQTSTAEKVGTAASLGLQTAFAASLIKPLPGGAVPTPTTSPSAGGKALTSFGTVGENREMAKNKDLWKKIVDVITKAVQKGGSTNMITKFASKFGYFAAAKFATVVAGIAAAPFSAGLSLLVSALGALLLVYDIYQIYEFFVALEKEMDADEKDSTVIRQESAPAITPPPNATQLPGGTVTSTSGGAATSVSRTPTRNAGGGRGFINPTSPSAASGDSRTAIEDYLGRKISDEEHDMLMRAVYAEASANKDEYANVMAVILNRTRKTGGTIIDTLTERNQFQAVTGTANNPGPSANFKRGPNEKSIAMINEGASSLSGISKSLDSFTAANRKAYGAGTNVAWLDKLQASGGKQIGQTVFAENMYRGGGGGKGGTTPAAATALASAPNTGNALLDIFAGYTKSKEDSMKQQGGGSTVVNAPVTNIAQNSGGGSGSATPYNTDMMKYLLRPVT